MTKNVDHGAYARDYAASAQRITHALADELVILADRLRELAGKFEDATTGKSLDTPSGVAADIVSAYVHLTGSGSTRLGPVVHDAGRAEFHRAAQRG